MESEQHHSPEEKSQVRDISREFLEMNVFEFMDFLRTLRKEPELSITVDWESVGQARRLKAFLEQIVPGQKRTAAIRATRDQYMQELNVFASGVKWIEKGPDSEK